MMDGIDTFPGIIILLKELQEQHKTQLMAVTGKFERIRAQLFGMIAFYQSQCQKLKKREQDLLETINNPRLHPEAEYRHLKQEVDSLQAVIGLKNQELHEVRKHSETMKQQLEALPVARDQIHRMQQKIENLEAIVMMKTDYEKELSEKYVIQRRKLEAEIKIKEKLMKENESLRFVVHQSKDISLLSPLPAQPSALVPSQTDTPNNGQFEHHEPNPKPTQRPSIQAMVSKPNLPQEMSQLPDQIRRPKPIRATPNYGPFEDPVPQKSHPGQPLMPSKQAPIMTNHGPSQHQPIQPSGQVLKPQGLQATPNYNPVDKHSPQEPTNMPVASAPAKVSSSETSTTCSPQLLTHLAPRPPPPATMTPTVTVPLQNTIKPPAPNLSSTQPLLQAVTQAPKSPPQPPTTRATSLIQQLSEPTPLSTTEAPPTPLGTPSGQSPLAASPTPRKTPHQESSTSIPPSPSQSKQHRLILTKSPSQHIPPTSQAKLSRSASLSTSPSAPSSPVTKPKRAGKVLPREQLSGAFLMPQNFEPENAKAEKEDDLNTQKPAYIKRTVRKKKTSIPVRNMKV